MILLILPQPLNPVKIESKDAIRDSLRGDRLYNCHRVFCSRKIEDPPIRKQACDASNEGCYVGQKPVDVTWFRFKRNETGGFWMDFDSRDAVKMKDCASDASKSVKGSTDNIAGEEQKSSYQGKVAQKNTEATVAIARAGNDGNIHTGAVTKRTLPTPTAAPQSWKVYKCGSSSPEAHPDWQKLLLRRENMSASLVHRSNKDEGHIPAAAATAAADL